MAPIGSAIGLLANNFIQLQKNFILFPVQDDLIGSLDSSSLLRFYVVNKSTLDTRNDLVVKLLEHISRLDQVEMKAPKAEPLPPTPPQYSYTIT